MYPLNSGDLEHWLIAATALLSFIALAKKLMPRQRHDEEFATRVELHNEVGSVRDKIDARFFTLSEKIEGVGGSLHARLAELERAVARVDERTK
jgi:hypothetical protein